MTMGRLRVKRKLACQESPQLRQSCVAEGHNSGGARHRNTLSTERKRGVMACQKRLVHLPVSKNNFPYPQKKLVHYQNI